MPEPFAPTSYGAPPAAPLGYGLDNPSAVPAYSGPVKTDGFAIASLVLGLLGGSVLALIFGFVALGRIRRSNGAKSGRGLAITGIVLGGIVLAALVIVVGTAIADQADRDSSGDVVGGGSMDAMSIEVGDCLTDGLPGDGEEQLVSSVRATPCNEPHTAQIVASFDLTGTVFPGEDAVATIVDERCADLVGNALNRASDAYELSTLSLYPTEVTWTVQHDREVLCGVASTSPISESLVSGSAG